jgi:aerobic carbon-monoxide dehydrogenase medium subunit
MRGRARCRSDPPTVDSAAVKPQSFEYRAPASLDEALALLAEHGDAASVLAGGQSLVPLLNLRLARPALVVDINRLPGLDAIEVDAGRLRLGALVRHRALERPAEPGPAGRLLARVAPRVGHPPIRNRGTVCGSLAHADPAAEWALVGLAAGAEVSLASTAGRRQVAVDALLDSPFATHRRPDELILHVAFPRWPTGQVGTGFVERARTAGSFAELAACVVIRVDAGPVGAGPADAGPVAGGSVDGGPVDGGRVVAADIAVAGVGGRPVLLPGAAATLLGQRLTAALRDEVAALAAAQIEPRSGAGAEPPGYQRAIVEVMVADALAQAAAELGAGGPGTDGSGTGGSGTGEVAPAWRSC